MIRDHDNFRTKVRNKFLYLQYLTTYLRSPKVRTVRTCTAVHVLYMYTCVSDYKKTEL